MNSSKCIAIRNAQTNQNLTAKNGSYLPISRLSLAICLLMLPTTWSLLAAQAVKDGTQARKTLDQALAEQAVASGVQLVYNPKILQNRQPKLAINKASQGNAIDQLLEDTDYRARVIGNNALALNKKNASAITGDENTDKRTQVMPEVLVRSFKVGSTEAMKNETYYGTGTQLYLDRTEIQRYKGHSPADVITRIPGVTSGDPRNGGGLDPNIRGFQGAGRAPIYIDGTENGQSVWRGYNGQNYRSYIDPGALSSITVKKGTSIIPGFTGGSAGTIIAKTLEPEEIISEGKSWGLEILTEGGNNSTSPYIPRLRYDEDLKPEDIGLENGWFDVNSPKKDNGLNFRPSKRKEGGWGNLSDYGYRGGGLRF